MIVARTDEFGRNSSYNMCLPHNGKYLRRWDGLLISRDYDPKRELIMYAAINPEDTFTGVITDAVLVKRIQEYLDQYYGKCLTNCSAFAHFLFTGEFSECRDENNLAVVHHHMRHYRKPHKVGVGDMLCVVYGRKRIGQSRKTLWRNAFHEVRKSRHDKGACLSRALMNSEPVMSPEDILMICRNRAVTDYHFMICVDIRHGQPVWLSQLGRDYADGDYAPFGITLGNQDLQPKDTPLLCLIKRRR